MSDNLESQEHPVRPEASLNPDDYSSDVLFYPGENRIDVNVIPNYTIERGFYDPNSLPPLTLFISPTPLPEEVRE